MRTPDPTTERAIAESRLRSLINPPRRPRRLLPYRRTPSHAPHKLTTLTTRGQQLAKNRIPGTHRHQDSAPLRPTDPSPPIRHSRDGTATLDSAPYAATPNPGTFLPTLDPDPFLAIRDADAFYSGPDPTSLQDHDPTSETVGSPSATDDFDQHAFPSPDSGHQPFEPPPRHPNTAAAPISPSFQAFRAALTSRAPTLDPGRPGLRVLLAIGAVAVAAAVYFVWQSQPTPQPLPPPTPTALVTPTPAATIRLTVHVTGKVRKPGVYLLPAGTRVADAVTAAGGPSRTSATGSLNLARRLIDGEQIVVGAPGTSAAASGASPAEAVLDLNTATPDQLEQLPGVGEVLAARIAEFRDSHGGFTSVEQLREVSGIGVRKYAEIKPKVRI
ncbi:helix-hairpin-helix domain-containing protein [Nonomuraea bangladeshensis]|uniref:helix-hairpin-helix domain-containing protein n=1 Tax=Nonomuraea bangladeshensis TaxID=404385 RepID=UPI003C2CE3B7